MADRPLLDLEVWARGTRPHGNEVLVVAIDDTSLIELGYEYPWPRTVIAQLVDALRRYEVATIGIDLLLAEHREGDADLAGALASGPPVVLASKFEAEIGDGYRLLQHVRPTPELARSASQLGFVNLPLDSDGFVRWAEAYRSHLGHEMKAFWQAVASSFNGQQVFDRDMYRINYCGPSGEIDRVSAYQVIGGLVPAERLRGKVALVGTTIGDLHDSFYTPFLRYGVMPGVEVQANLVQMAIDRSWLNDLPPAEALLLYIVYGLAILTALGLLPMFQGLVLSAAVAFVSLVVSFIALGHGLVIQPSTPIVLFIVSSIVVYGGRYVVAEMDRLRTRSVLDRYVPSEVVDELLRQGEQNLAVRRTEITALFCDVRDFTALAGSIAPEQVVRILDEFFEVAYEVVAANHGIIDKYLGDGFMALFGTLDGNRPYALIGAGDHKHDAVRSAVQLIQKVSELGSVASGGTGAPLRLGIGIHTGVAVVGSVGSRRRAEYTAIGDVVNIASRLEQLTKELQATIAISGEVYDALRSVVDGETALPNVVDGEMASPSVLDHETASPNGVDSDGGALRDRFLAKGNVQLKGVDRPLRIYVL